MHNVELLERLCDRIEKELDEQYHKIEKASQISPSDLEITDTLLHALKSLKTVMAMEESDSRYSGGYSGARYRNEYYSHYPSVNDYSGSRDSMGRYSRDDEKSDVIARLEGMMRNVHNESDALSIKDAINAVNRIR